MKPRARRVVIGAAALVAVVVAVLVVAHWGTVRDHVEAWHFQLTRETVTIGLDTPCPLIIDSDDLPEDWRNFYNDLSAGSSAFPRWHDVYRFLEQSFPRRAYVVIREPDPPEEQPSSRLSRSF